MFKTGTRRHPPHARCRARPVGLPPYSAVHARRGRPATPGSFAVPTGSCAWYFWAQVGATRRNRMRRAAAPPAAIGSPRRPTYAVAAVLWPCHCPYRGLLPWRARRPPCRLELSYKSWPSSLTRGCTALPSRHCRRLRAHGEPLAPAAFTANTCCSYLH
jgi:hypothetical protein